MFRYLTLSKIVGPSVVNINSTMDLILKGYNKSIRSRENISLVLKSGPTKHIFSAA